MRFLILTLLVLGCGTSEKEPAEAVDLSSLDGLRQDIESWVQPCSFEGIEYPCEQRPEGPNDDHVTLLAGNMGLSGSTEFCEAVYRAQDGDGKIWRSPAQVGVKQGNSTSRDMLTGFMGCLAVVPNPDAAWRFYRYVSDRGYKLCGDADDNRCDFHPRQYWGSWATLRHVFIVNGLKPTPTMEKAARGGENTLWGQAKFSEVGYQLNLVALQMLIRKKTDRWQSANSKTVKELVKRQDKNPFFRWLHEGTTQRVVDLVAEKCPRERPERADEWTWSRDQDKAEDQGRSMGYDCLFMLNLMGL